MPYLLLFWGQKFENSIPTCLQRYSVVQGSESQHPRQDLLMPGGTSDVSKSALVTWAKFRSVSTIAATPGYASCRLFTNLVTWTEGTYLMKLKKKVPPVPVSDPVAPRWPVARELDHSHSLPLSKHQTGMQVTSLLYCRFFLTFHFHFLVVVAF